VSFILERKIREIVTREGGGFCGGPSDGFFHVVPVPARRRGGWLTEWFLTSMPFSRFVESSREEHWDSYVSRCLGLEWAKRLNGDADQFRLQLRGLSLATPHGRIERGAGDHWSFVCADDFPVPSALIFNEVLVDFCLIGQTVEFVQSKAQSCAHEQKERLRTILGLQEDWTAIPIAALQESGGHSRAESTTANTRS